VILNIRIDHNTADICTIEKSTCQMDELFEKIKNEHLIREYLQIKTCNRAELYLVLDEFYIDNLDFGDFVVETDDDALKHLLRLSCGLESMIIGEDQILGQIKDVRKRSLKEEYAGEILNTVFTKAIHVGQTVRKKTHINRGSISIGSAAVELAESVHGDLKCKKVLVIGAGKMGTLVAKALVQKHLKAIVVANRTYDRAVDLAKELGGFAIHFDKLDEAMSDADVIISATGAPHPILTCEKMKNAVSEDKLDKLVMVDIANPRDIDEEVKELGIKLFNIDDLRGIADRNRKMRETEAKAAEEIIEEELQLLKKSLKRLEVESLISNIRSNVEKIRAQETEKAVRMLGDINGKEKIVDDLTQVVVDKIFCDIIRSL
jgi:glutamyl-tRNA reductase